MGKVLSTFENGWPGAPSRSVDEVITTMKNNTSAEIPFGAAVFLVSGRNACAPFNPASSCCFCRMSRNRRNKESNSARRL